MTRRMTRRSAAGCDVPVTLKKAHSETSSLVLEKHNEIHVHPETGVQMQFTQFTCTLNNYDKYTFSMHLTLHIMYLKHCWGQQYSVLYANKAIAVMKLILVKKTSEWFCLSDLVPVTLHFTMRKNVHELLTALISFFDVYFAFFWRDEMVSGCHATCCLVWWGGSGGWGGRGWEGGRYFCGTLYVCM